MNFETESTLLRTVLVDGWTATVVYEVRSFSNETKMKINYMKNVNRRMEFQC